MQPTESDPALQRHVARLIASFKHWTGRDLVDPELPIEKRVSSLWNAPFVLVSHGTEVDPVLNFGNPTALNLWEMTWDEFTATPSRFTAEPVNREERTRLLEQVTRFGFIQNYSGVRISKNGRRFRIAHAWVWNILDENRKPAGQAAMFDQWTWIEPA